MDYTYEYRNNDCALVCSLTEERIDDFSYRMLKGNQISNIICPSYEQGEDGYERLVYELKGKCTLIDYLAYYNSIDRINILCDGIKRAWSELESYMIDNRFCIWDINYVYVDCESGEPFVVCLPIDRFVCEAFIESAYIKYIEGYTEVRDMSVMEISPEYDDDMYDDDYYETRVLMQSEYDWCDQEPYVEKNIKIRKEVPGTKSEKRKSIFGIIKKRQPKVVRISRVEENRPCYIIPG